MSLDLQSLRCPTTVNGGGFNGCAVAGFQRMLHSNHLYHPLNLSESHQSHSETEASKMECIANTRRIGLLFFASILLSLSLVVVLTDCQSFQLIRPIKAKSFALQTPKSSHDTKGASSWLLPAQFTSTGSSMTTASTTTSTPSTTPITNLQPACRSLLGIDSRVITDFTAGIDTAITTRAQSDGPLSFPIVDIDIPVAEGDAPVKSAIKLLSALSDQFEEYEESDNILRFRDSKTSITRMNLSMLNIHLQKDEAPKFSIGISFFNTSISGRFAYNGTVKLGSYYKMNIDNVLLTSSSNLSNHMGVLRTDDFSLNVTSLGYMRVEFFDDNNSTQPTRNYALQMLQKFIQKTIKRIYGAFESKIRPTLEQAIRHLIDCELYHLSLPMMNVSDKNYQHQLSLVVNKWITKLRFDVFDLPEFNHEQSLVGLLAKVEFSNGSLSGLNHVYFSGDSRLKLQGKHLLLNSSLGWTDLRAHYNWNLTMGNNSKNSITKGFVAFDIKRVEFGAVITKGLSHQSRFVVERLGIETLDGPKMDITGLPGMNRLTRTLVNFFMNRLKERIVSSIQLTLKKQLERTLNKLPSLVLFRTL